MNRRQALKTLGKGILAGAMLAATSLTILGGCERKPQEEKPSKEGILEKKLTDFEIWDAHFGPDDKVYYRASSMDDEIYILSVKELTVRKLKDARLFVKLRDFEEDIVPDIMSMHATKYGIAAISRVLPLKYKPLQEKKEEIRNYLYVFTPDGKLVSSKNIEDRVTCASGIFLGDEKCFYSFYGNYQVFIPLDGSRPIKREREAPGFWCSSLGKYQKKRLKCIFEFLRKEVPPGEEYTAFRDMRETEEGIELLYCKDIRGEDELYEKYGVSNRWELYYKKIPEEKIPDYIKENE